MKNQPSVKLVKNGFLGHPRLPRQPKIQRVAQSGRASVL